MVENRLIQLGLWEQFADYPNVTLLCPDTLKDITFGDTHVVTLQSGTVLHCDWIIGADGANSRVRELAGIGVTAWDYRQHCMLINVETEKPQQDVTWQQFFPSGPTFVLTFEWTSGVAGMV